MSNELIVCCVRWGTRYPALYYNRLRHMVERHLRQPHEFVVLTDNAEGLEPGIRTVPPPDNVEGWWGKLSFFRDDLFEPGRTLIYLDVDVVIVGSLDFLVEDSADLRIIRNFGADAGFNSSVMRIRAGSLPHIYESFAADAEAIMAGGVHTDQSWIHECYPEAPVFPRGPIVSYKRDMNAHVLLAAKKLGMDFAWLKAPTWMTVEPPEGASIIVFHGKPDPEDVMDAPYGPWKRAPFIKEHWR